MFTDGDDTSSRVGRGTVMDRARAEEVMIYAIGLQSEYFDGQRMVRSKPDSGLRRLADETGGGYFELKQTGDLGPTFTRVAQELHSQYVLGFEAPQLDGKVHKLTVKMKQVGMTARARRSYVAAAAQAPSGKMGVPFNRRPSPPRRWPARTRRRPRRWMKDHSDMLNLPHRHVGRGLRAKGLQKRR